MQRLFGWTLSIVIICSFSVDKTNGNHCNPKFSECLNDDTYPSQLILKFEFSYNQLEHCNDPVHCDDSTVGTGHSLYSEVEVVASVERCYSYCFTNASASFVNSGSIYEFELSHNPYAQDRCSGTFKTAFVCYSACLYRLKMLNPSAEALSIVPTLESDNATCDELCWSGICDHALPSDASQGCIDSCRMTVCPAACESLEASFPDLATNTEPVYWDTISANLHSPESLPLQKAGVMEYSLLLTVNNKPIPNFFPTGSFSRYSLSKAYGLIWKVILGGKTTYIPQHQPLFLRDEQTELFQTGPNLLAIRELQCKQNLTLEVALADESKISRFTRLPSPSCFKGSWFPRPQQNLTAEFGYVQSTSDLFVEIDAALPSPDKDNADGYGVMFLSGNDLTTSPTCKTDLGQFSSVLANRLMIEKDDGSVVYRGVGESEVTSIFPNYWSACKYLLLVYAGNQTTTSLSGRQILPAGDVYSVIVNYPDYENIQMNATSDVVWDNQTGRPSVFVSVKITSGWTSLAVLRSIIGRLELQGLSQAVLDRTTRISIPANASVTDYTFHYPAVKPLDPESDNHYSWKPEYLDYRYPKLNVNYHNFFNIPIQILARRPGLVRNVTVSELRDHVANQLSLNITWLAPHNPNGKIMSYDIVVSSRNVQSIREARFIPPPNAGEDDLLYQEMTVDLLVDEQLNVSIQAISEFYDLRGDWFVAPVENFLSAPTQAVESVPWYTYAIVGVMVGALLVLTIIVAVCIYYYMKRNKVVIVKNTGIFINGTQEGGEMGDVEDDVFQPMEVDHWEISPDYIIMDCMLGEGQFGEVYKGMIKGIVNNPYVRGSEAAFVAVKILRPEASASLKSDFLKEITTMKKITMGSCPNVVNMVGCCTLQEPLALVQEYVPHGDLLTYLRAIRKMNQLDYYPVPSPTGGNHGRGNEYVNNAASPALPMTPMTPASTCPLLLGREGSPHSNTPPPSSSTQGPFPYEKPYSSLGDLKPVHLIQFAHQIATGMKFLSDLGIVHRDLACRNILVGENKTLKISDFGLARENDIYIKTTDGKLPLRWMAVESIVDRVFTTKSDVWSFGIVLWEITTLGGHPYPSVGNKALLAQLLRGYRMEKPENCSSDLFQVMLQCWQADVGDRPSFVDLQASLDLLLTSTQSENYIDLNVDEMLPYYQMNSIQENTESLDDDDIKNGYPDTKNLNPSYFQGIQRPDSNASEVSISSTDVATLPTASTNSNRPMSIDKTNTASMNNHHSHHHPDVENPNSLGALDETPVINDSLSSQLKSNGEVPMTVCPREGGDECSKC